MFTSVRLRFEALRRFVKSRALRMTLPDAEIAELERMIEGEVADTAEAAWLAPIGGDGTDDRQPLLGMEPAEYIAIVDVAGRSADPRKPGKIPAQVRSALESIRIDVERWLEVVTRPARFVGTAIGSAVSLAVEASRRGTSRIVGAIDVCLL
jgi:hypothetical protein